MPFLNINGNKINYNVSGNGKHLILLHNGFYSTQSWENIRLELSKNFTVIDYDRFGYGKSDKFNGILNDDIMDTGVKELDGLVEKLGINDFFLCGHCLGGAIAIKYSIKFPDKVNKIIVESTGFFSDHKMQVKADYTFQKFDKIDNNLQNRLIAWHGLEYSRIFWNILKEYKLAYIMNKDYNILSELKKIKCPVLIINGDRDFYFDIEHALQAYKNIKNSQICILPGTGHDPHIESEIAFLNHLIKFLRL